MGGTWGLGMFYRKRMSERLESLRVMIRILEMIRSEISYGNADLLECFRNISRRMEDDCNEVISFQEVLDRTAGQAEERNGEDLSSILKSELEKAASDHSLNYRDIDIFTSFMGKKGFSDRILQTKMIEMSKAQLEERSDDLKTNIRERGRMAVGLGILGGILLVIILF